MRTKTCSVDVGLKDLRFVKQIGANIEFHYLDGVILTLKYATRKEAFDNYKEFLFYDPDKLSFNQFGLVGVEVKTQEQGGVE